ncbi:MAG: hypothetical protein HY658_13930 [Actinobacteria bacterium]|nr:hypothetical protein [Actinomycetota bacterium]
MASLTRRLAHLPVVFLLALSACSSGAGPEPVQPVPFGAAPPALSLQLASARQTVIDFLDGYAGIGEDDGEALLATLRGTGFLEHWAVWQEVTLGPTAREGSVVIEDIDPADFTSLGQAIPALAQDPAAGSQVLQVLVRAAVVFDPGGGAGAGQSVHDFSGVAVLSPRGTHEWLLLDVTKEGRSVLGSIRALNLRRETPQATVLAPSVFVVPGETIFNIIVENVGDRRLVLDPLRSGLRIGDEVLRPDRMTPELGRGLAPGGRVQGQFAFDPARFQDRTEVPILRVVLRGGERPLVIEFLLDGSGAAPPPEEAEPDEVAAATPLPTSPSPSPPDEA